MALAGLGAREPISTILLAHPDRTAAGQAIAACREEITRLERIFSLYRADSALSQLNRHGRLDDPPLELVELLAFSARVSAATGGAFDVTVQPLWDLYASHFADPEAIRPVPVRPHSLPPSHGSTGARSSSTRPESGFAGPAWR